jgi:tRNA threonylcarbamoyladenosine biosynthesis protein TsaB
MNYLICETSTLLGSACTLKSNRQIFEASRFRQGSHSDSLNLLITDTLHNAQLSLDQIDCFVTGLGPGSFTGIRIALNTIKAFAYASNKPVIGVNTLSTLGYQFNIAQQQMGEPPLSDLITVIINAYKNMVYLAQYKIDLKSKDLLTEILRPQVVRVQNLRDVLTTKTYVIGDGFIDYKEYLVKNYSDLILRPTNVSSELFDFPKSSTIAEMISNNADNFSHTTWSEVLPEYLRASEAEENKLGIIYQPL